MWVTFLFILELIGKGREMGIMKETIFPKEIIRFSTESHYFRFSKYSKSIYLLVVAIILACMAALPVVNVDITVQSRGIIRSQAEPTSVQTPVTGQVKKIGIHESYGRRREILKRL